MGNWAREASGHLAVLTHSGLTFQQEPKGKPPMLGVSLMRRHTTTEVGHVTEPLQSTLRFLGGNLAD